MKALRDAFANDLISRAQQNQNIVVLDCDVGKHTKMRLFQDRYPSRYFEIGICEQNAVGIAAGLARGGRLPVVSGFAAFICGRAWEQIRHSVVYNETNVKIFATHAGLSAGEDGGSHQCIEDIALMLALPQIEVYAPAFPTEIEKICSHITVSKKAAYIRVGRDVLPYDCEEPVTVGAPIVMGDKAAEIAVISAGEITQEVIKAYRCCGLFKMVHIGSLRPLDIESLRKELANVKKVVVVEEHTQNGGLLSLLFTSNIIRNVDVFPINMGQKFGQTGTVEELRRFYGLDHENIIKKIREFR